ncbi:MAG: guanylate kinase [Lachnospiraceae bacterium]|nr:guanylate kinase [Lachnospiraceae bacterium]
MGKIVCLMGRSSSGKDTIYKELLTQNQVMLQPIVPYTTRPIRAGESDGVEYHFTDEEGFLRLQNQGRVIEERVYHTCLGMWRYFTVADEEIDPKSGSYVVIGTLESYEQMRRFYGEDKVLPIMIELDDGVRLQRALDREMAQDHPRYEEMCRRFLADAEDFSKEKLNKAGISRTFYNGELSRCLEEILSYLQENCNEDDI